MSSQLSENIVSKQLEEHLNYFYKSYIQTEITCFRGEIEEAFFIYISYGLDILIKQNNFTELDRFIQYLIKLRQLFMNSTIRDELKTLQQHCTNPQYLEKFAAVYRFWEIKVSQKGYEKIQCINQDMCQRLNIFDNLIQKMRLTFERSTDACLLRYSIFTGLSSKQSKRIKQQNQQSKVIDKLCRIEENDFELILKKTKDEDKIRIDTLLQNEWLIIFSQIEKCINNNQNQEINFQLTKIETELPTYIQIPYQLAEFIKNELTKKRRENMDDETNKYSYWNYTQYKQIYKSSLIEALLQKKQTQGPSLINIKLMDYVNQISCMSIGQFGNVLLCGSFDGNIIVYELTESFLLPGQVNEQQEPKQNIDPYFIMNLHSGPILAIDILYDEYYLISVSTDNIIKLSCLRTRQPLIMYKGHQSKIWSLQFAPAGYLFASGSQDGTIMIWATDSVQSLIILGCASGVRCLKFTPSGNYLISGEEERILRVWSIEKGCCIEMIATTASILQINISFTGQFLSFGCQNGQIYLYYLPTMTEIKNNLFISNNEEEQIRGIDFSYDEQYFVVINESRIVFYELKNLIQPQGKDVFQGVYTEENLKRIEKEDQKIMKIQPKEMIEGIGYLVNCRYVPQNYCVCISK